MVFDRKQRGFTLIEMSIVLIIVGILTGLFMKSRVMLRDAKLKAVIVETQKVKRAAQSFHQKYGDWPGDLRTAQENISNCNAGNDCYSGNGDGRIDNTGINEPENEQFWKHMYLGGFITNEKMTDRVLPRSLWSVRYSKGSAVSPFINERGHWIIVSANVAGQCCFSLQEQKRLDKLNDDADSDTGLMVYSSAVGAVPNEASGDEITDGGMAFKLDK
jgi:prepilin-type N-terminal cleavage/methylation domain-containing protein